MIYLLCAEGLNYFHSAQHQSISPFHTQGGGIHRKDNCLSSEPGTSRSSRVPARQGRGGQDCSWLAGAAGWETSLQCWVITGSSGVRANRGLLSILESVYGALLPELYLELQIFPVKALG